MTGFCLCEMPVLGFDTPTPIYLAPWKGGSRCTCIYILYIPLVFCIVIYRYLSHGINGWYITYIYSKNQLNVGKYVIHSYIDATMGKKINPQKNDSTTCDAGNFNHVAGNSQIISKKQRILIGNMGVSKNRGIPKSSIFIGFSLIHHPFWGYHYCLETP